MQIGMSWVMEIMVSVNMLLRYKLSEGSGSFFKQPLNE